MKITIVITNWYEGMEAIFSYLMEMKALNGAKGRMEIRIGGYTFNLQNWSEDFVTYTNDRVTRTIKFSDNDFAMFEYLNEETERRRAMADVFKSLSSLASTTKEEIGDEEVASHLLYAYKEWMERKGVNVTLFW